MKEAPDHTLAGLRYTKKRYEAALEWLRDNKSKCYKYIDGILLSIKYEDCISHLERQIKLLKNETEKIRLQKAIGA